MSDKREHHPNSPSALAKKDLCSFWESAWSKAASRGDDMHLYFQDLCMNTVGPASAYGLPDEDRKAVEWAYDVVKPYLEGEREVLVEQRHELVDEFGSVLTFGYTDLESRVENTLDFFDLKSGQQRDYTTQMDAYARMLMLEYGFTKCCVHLLYCDSEWAESREVTLEETEYIQDLLYRLNNEEDAEPHTNEYCDWCKHKENCKAVRREVEAVSHGYNPDQPPVSLSSWHSSQIVDPAEMAKALEIAKTVEGWASAVKHHATQMAKAGVEIPGYKLSKKTTRSCTDIAAVFEASGLEPHEFIACCNLSIGKYEMAVATRMGAKTVNKKVKKELEETVGGYFDSKESSGHLVKSKK
jgi:hypothetical protein